MAEIKANENVDMIVCVSHSGTWDDPKKSEDELLAKGVHAIIDSWKDRELTREEFEIVEHLKSLEENQYPCSEVD